MAASRRSILVSLLAEDQEFQRLQADDARATASRSGLDAEVLFADNSAILQIQQLYRAIHRPIEARPAAIVVETVVGEGLERVAHAAVEARASDGSSSTAGSRTSTICGEATPSC